jgi:sulfofructose kinase
MATISCVGIAVHDYLFSMDELPHGGGKHYATGYREVGGGVAANAAAAIAKLGGAARYVGRVGDDRIGDRILADLAALGVDVGGVEQLAGVSSPVSAVLVDGAGERTIINYTSETLFDAGDTERAADVAGVDGVLVDVRWPAGAARALSAAAEAGIPSVFDFDRPMGDGGASLLGLASHVVFSEAALAETAALADPGEGLLLVRERTNAFLAVTTGAGGVWWLDDGLDVRHQPAFAVDVVDTVGAGDVFHGAFALALAERKPEDAALRFAAAAAALKCARPGGRAGAPTRAEVEELLKGNE